MSLEEAERARDERADWAYSVAMTARDYLAGVSPAQPDWQPFADLVQAAIEAARSVPMTMPSQHKEKES